jgi:cytochrome b561
MDVRYSRTAVFLHWLVAGLMFLQFPLGWLMQQIARQPPGLRTDAFSLHKSIGLVILSVVVARLAWRLSHPVGPLAASPPWQQRVASLTHGALYALILAMAISGYLSSVYSGRPIVFFGLPIPSWSPRVRDVEDLMDAIHLWASWALLATFTLHLAGAFSHRGEGAGLAGRMDPRARASPYSGFSSGT